MHFFRYCHWHHIYRRRPLPGKQPFPECSAGNPRLGGKLSRRSEESVTAWRFAVLESDEADADDWLRCLIQMPLRIVSICESQYPLRRTRPELNMLSVASALNLLSVLAAASE